MAMIVWLLDLQLPVQSEPITTKFVSSNPVHGEMYTMQHYVIKFITDSVSLQVSGFPGTPVSSNKTDCRDITEILLKVALNTINHQPFDIGILCFYRLVVGQIDDLLIYCQYGVTKQNGDFVPDPSGCQEKIEIGKSILLTCLREIPLLVLWRDKSIDHESVTIHYYSLFLKVLWRDRSQKYTP